MLPFHKEVELWEGGAPNGGGWSSGESLSDGDGAGDGDGDGDGDGRSAENRSGRRQGGRRHGHHNHQKPQSLIGALLRARGGGVVRGGGGAHAVGADEGEVWTAAAAVGPAVEYGLLNQRLVVKHGSDD